MSAPFGFNSWTEARWMVEAALRSLLVAGLVWAGMRALRVTHVVARKTAFSLVLLSALAMPLLMRWNAFRAGPALVLPTTTELRAQFAPPGAQSAPHTAPPASLTALAANPAHAGGATPNAAPPSSRSRSTYQAASSGAHAVKASVPAPKHTAQGAAIASAASGKVFAAPMPEHPLEPASEASEPGAASLTMRALGISVVPGASPSHWTRAQLLGWAVDAYVLMAALLLARLAVGLLLSLRLWATARRASPMVEPRAHVRISSRIDSPVTVGSGIVLPSNYTEWSNEKLRIVLAHERSHVRQGDFYLQVLAQLYAAIFWPSPLGWWLKRELSELGEAISDRAALAEASSRPHYAEVLLEFAASGRAPLTAVAMARPGQVQQRIDRLLSDGMFERAFARVRRHALLVLALVPVAVLASTSVLRVEAAETLKGVRIAALQAPTAPPAAITPDGLQAPSPPAQAFAPPTPPSPVEGVQAPAPPAAVPAVAAVPATAAAPASVTAPEPPETHAMAALDLEDAESQEAPLARRPVERRRTSHTRMYSDGGRDNFAVVDGDSSNVYGSSDFAEEADKLRDRLHGRYILFERDDKTYIIDDPALVAQAREFYAPMEKLGRQQEELGRKQEELGREEEKLGEQQELVSVPSAELVKKLEKMEADLKALQLEKKVEIRQDDLAKVQEQLANMQGELGELQGKAGDKMGELGRQQGELGKQQGQLGEEQGRLGEQQGRMAREAEAKIKALIDQAQKNGKARPAP